MPRNKNNKNQSGPKVPNVNMLQKASMVAVAKNAPSKALVPIPKTGIVAAREGGRLKNLTDVPYNGNNILVGDRKKKTKKKGFLRQAWEFGKRTAPHVWRFLKGATRMAAEIAPYVLPLFAAKHQPTLLAMQAAGIAPGSPEHAQLIAQTHMAVAADKTVPLAMGSGSNLMSKVGLISYRTKSRGGKVSGAVLRGMDYLAPVKTGASAADTGDLLYSAELSPLASAFVGTRVAQLAATYEMYKFRKIVIVYEPACAATEQGGMIGFIDPDPTDTDNFAGVPAIRKAAAHQGSDENQVWAAGCYSLPGDRKRTDLFVDADGSDVRWVKFGKFFLHATAPIDASTSCGNLYVLYDFEVDYPQIDDDNPSYGVQLFMHKESQFSNCSFTNPWGDYNPSLYYEPATNADLPWFGDGNVFWLQGLPVGSYCVDSLVIGTGFTEDATPEGAVEFDSATTGTVTNLHYFGTTTTVNSWDRIEVLEYIDPNTIPHVSRGLKYNADLTAVTTVTDILIRIIQLSTTTVMSKKRKTLQDYEEKIDNIEPKILELQEKMSLIFKVINNDSDKGKMPFPQLQLVDTKLPPSVSVKFGKK